MCSKGAIMTRVLSLRVRAYPSDLNPIGTVFGGWIMAKMDKAASIAVEDIVEGTAVTVAVSNLHFIKPVHNGDIVTFYTTISDIGRSSIEISVEAEVRCRRSRCEMQVTNAIFTFVTVNEKGKPIAVSSVLREGVEKEIVEMAKH